MYSKIFRAYILSIHVISVAGFLCCCSAAYNSVDSRIPEKLFSFYCPTQTVQYQTKSENSIVYSDFCSLSLILCQ